MAACDTASLLSDACDNGLLQIASDEVLSRGIILQLFYNAAGGTETETELLDEACDNGFLAIAGNESLFRTVLLQLFCNIGGGT